MSPSLNESAPIARRRRRGWWWKLLIAASLIAGVVYYFAGGEKTEQTGATWQVKRGTLAINVVDNGSIEALEKQEIRSEVHGQTKILSIVEEGYQVTEDDVKNKKVLVQLDSADLVKSLTNEEIEFQSALATYADAKEQFDIQVKENESDLKAALLAAKFQRLDFQKYLSAELANRIIKDAGLDVDLDSVKTTMNDVDIETELGVLDDEEKSPAPAEGASSAAAEGSSAVPANSANAEAFPAPAPTREPANSAAPIAAKIKKKGSVEMALTAKPVKERVTDFSPYANADLLGDGEAHQELRKLENERLLAETELGVNEKQYEGTKRLYEQKFVTENELKNDEMKVTQSTISRDAAETAQRIFLHYEFPKEAEKLLSDYEEGLSKLSRTWKQAVSKLAQAQAKLKSSEAKYNLQRKQRDDLQQQIAKCTIVAERPGLVVYAGNDEYWRSDVQIEEGATVREQQQIITIPDMTKMAIKVKVHEASVKQVKKGQKATIRLDAYPEKALTGVVDKVALMPSATSRWMNPDVKLYDVMIAVDGAHEWLKPGMSGEVTVHIKEIPDALQVPLQAVYPKGKDRFAYVVSALGKTEARPVEVGEYNESFIEVKGGLKEGDVVLLRAPLMESGRDRRGGADSAGGGASENKTDDGAKDKDKGKRSEKPAADNAQEKAPKPEGAANGEGNGGERPRKARKDAGDAAAKSGGGGA